jgi:anti-sigma factor RsiW
MSGYIDGELATSRGRRLERHVDECDECRRVLRGLERMVGRLHRIGIPAEAPDPRKLAARVRERLEERRLPNAS